MAGHPFSNRAGAKAMFSSFYFTMKKKVMAVSLAR